MTPPNPPAPGPVLPTSRSGYLLLGLAILTCPCHLPLLLMILAVAGVAGVLSPYLALAALGLTVIFVLLALMGLKALRSAEERPPSVSR